jgi:hypothetical protein
MQLSKSREMDLINIKTKDYKVDFLRISLQLQILSRIGAFLAVG